MFPFSSLADEKKIGARMPQQGVTILMSASA